MPDAKKPETVWIEAGKDCDDLETYDELCALLMNLVEGGETFSIEQSTFMIGLMGLEEDECGMTTIVLRA